MEEEEEQEEEEEEEEALYLVVVRLCVSVSGRGGESGSLFFLKNSWFFSEDRACGDGWDILVCGLYFLFRTTLELCSSSYNI